MEKLIIKCVICNTAHPEVKALYQMTPEETAQAAVRAQEAGAAAIHFHEPYKDGKPMGLEGWQLVPKLIREMGSDVIIEHGQGGMPYSISGRSPTRDPKNDLRIEHKNGTEMMVTSLGFIDHALLGPDGIFTDESMHRRLFSGTRAELLTNTTYYRECGVKPRLETFGIPGPFRNLQWLVKKKSVDPPYCLTANFGMEGIAGDPGEIRYLQQRIEFMPPDLKDDINMEVSVYQAGTPRNLLHTYAVAVGLHIRIGMEDMPYYWTGVPAKDNVELIERCVRIAKEYHRDVADSSEARKMYKLPSTPPGL